MGKKKKVKKAVEAAAEAAAAQTAAPVAAATNNNNNNINCYPSNSCGITRDEYTDNSNQRVHLSAVYNNMQNLLSLTGKLQTTAIGKNTGLASPGSFSSGSYSSRSTRSTRSTISSTRSLKCKGCGRCCTVA